MLRCFPAQVRLQNSLVANPCSIFEGDTYLATSVPHTLHLYSALFGKVRLRLCQVHLHSEEQKRRRGALSFLPQ